MANAPEQYGPVNPYDMKFNDGPGRLMDGLVAVITGGGGGIGAAGAELFAQHGATVVVAEIDAKLAESTVHRIRKAGGKAESFIIDVRDDKRIPALRDAVLDKHGRCDVLVNNVGHWVARVNDFLDGGPEHWDALHKTNLWHMFTVSHAFLPSMVKNKKGTIINVSSIEGMRGFPQDPVYGAYKAAVVHFTKCLAVQMGQHGIRVNGIGPDLCDSLQVPYANNIPAGQGHLWPMWAPIGRMGIPSDQARVLLFLASDLSGWVTGHTIPTDGGSGAAGGWFRSTSRPGRTWTNRPIAP
ncbi:MAG TPA: SDR family oxidoreductase [Burkholderiales bacterium]|nr:SDR family oxidoreductase [Burkholderiales bacterium]